MTPSPDDLDNNPGPVHGSLLIGSWHRLGLETDFSWMSLKRDLEMLSERVVLWKDNWVVLLKAAWSRQTGSRCGHGLA